jgi:hypothetical protein
MFGFANQHFLGHLNRSFFFHGQGVHVVYAASMDTLFEQKFQENLFFKVRG